MFTVTKEMFAEAMDRALARNPHKKPETTDIAYEVRLMIKAKMTLQKKVFMKELIQEMHESYASTKGDFGTGISIDD